MNSVFFSSSSFSYHFPEDISFVVKRMEWLNAISFVQIVFLWVFITVSFFLSWQTKQRTHFNCFKRKNHETIFTHYTLTFFFHFGLSFSKCIYFHLASVDMFPFNMNLASIIANRHRYALASRHTHTHIHVNT